MRMQAGLLAAAVLVATVAAAAAQVPYQPAYQPPSAAAYQAPATPPSWSWDPYTSGLGPCVQQNWGNSPPCRDFMEPTYGQPDYWPRR